MEHLVMINSLLFQSNIKWHSCTFLWNPRFRLGTSSSWVHHAESHIQFVIDLIFDLWQIDHCQIGKFVCKSCRESIVDGVHSSRVLPTLSCDSDGRTNCSTAALLLVPTLLQPTRVCVFHLRSLVVRVSNARWALAAVLHNLNLLGLIPSSHY